MSSSWLTRCPAKINLFLRVLPPEPSGYHPLETEFLALSLCDELWVEPGDGHFTYEGDPIPPENTLTKTMRLAQEAINIPNLNVHLRKRIPSQAGLGGGSSDAGGLLRILRRIVPSAIPNHEFESIAKCVGADVPFFLHGGHAQASGYGDIITPADDLNGWFVLLFPAATCSTPAMYSALDEYRDLKSGLRAGDWEPSWPAGLIENDFHVVAPPPCLAAIDAVLGQGPIRAGLSGSGSAVFAEFESEFAANVAKNQLNEAGFKGIAVRSLTRVESTACELTYRFGES